MKKTNRSTLAPLAFGESSASAIESLLDYQDLLLGFFPSLDTFQNLDSTKPFQSKMSSVSVNGLELFILRFQITITKPMGNSHLKQYHSFKDFVFLIQCLRF